MRRTPWIVAGLVLLLTFPLRAATDPLPSQQTIRDTYAAGDYPKTLQLLQRVLVLKGKAAEGYDRHELLLIKAETHIRMKASQPAISAFAEASKIAPDGPAAALDIATELLFRKVNAGYNYQPKLKDKDDKTKSLPPVNVIEMADRKKAIELLYADELAAVTPKVAAAKDGRTLPPILSALPDIRNVRWLEMAATGSDGTTKTMVADLIGKAKKLLESAMEELTESTDSIEKASMEVITARVPVNDPMTGKIIRFDTKYKYRGPDNKQFGTLKNTLATCLKIHESCDELGGTLGATGKEFDGPKATAATVGTKAKKLLDYNWRQNFDTPPAPPK
ncbi:hypothetical protein [Humisphaera borealis]|uniref:Tetratricopeptide repeat protein n=1 Tax=Humisphaera borealis TaxID=2807512 RepID=A0A7M2WW54_9BACT|nr:hypothetical protein [Humisphaera borealis]QOV89081.1 hypothetical protein IPV69_23135 [Humisphaera borealis]